MNPVVSPTECAAVDAVMRSRRSVRAYLQTPVPKSTVEDILRVASRAPSGTNIQAWKVRVLAGAARLALSEAILAEMGGMPEDRIEREYHYYPRSWHEPYVSRRRKIGWDMYGLLGITKGDKEAMARQHARNYRFFDAPVGMVFSMDEDMEIGGWIDLGMFMQNIMIAARARGLDTCPQAAIGSAQKPIRAHLGIPEGEVIICGMALGYADAAAAVNQLMTERVPVEEFALFYGFD
jgi:nitroreductase